MISPEDVLNAQFASSGPRAGYSTDAVDDYLDQVVHAMRAGESLPRWDRAAIATVRTQGYQFAEVDAFLISLGVLDPQAPAPGQPAGAVEAGGPAGAVQPGSYDHTRPGLLRRLFGKG